MNEKTASVLVVEDEVAHAELIRRAFENRAGLLLEEGAPVERLQRAPDFRVGPSSLTFARSLREAHASLQAAVPDLVVADLRLPDGQGTELLPADRESAPYPVVIMTGHGDEQRAVDAMKAGALDYVVKSEATLADMPRITERALREWDHITERKRAARELQRMRSYLKNIIDSMPSLVVGVDTEGRVTEWNTGAEQATGVPVSEALGRGFTELLPTLESQLEKVCEAVRRRTPMRAERLVMEEKEGEPRYADVTVYPLLANGAGGAVIRVDDITDRVRIEQMMVQPERMVSLGGLAAGMAHEINNPLSGVLQGSQNILRRFSLDLAANRRTAESLGLELERVHRYVEERGILGFAESVQEAANRASRIVADMLSFSHITTTEFEPARVDEMLDTVVRLAASDYDLTRKYDFKDVEIVRDYEPAREPVHCDRMEMEQVFLNLVRNAAQSMVAGGKPPYRMTLRTRRESDYARIEVQDNGPGMDHKTRSRVFQPFFTTKAAEAGAGLGLCVSYFIVTDLHHGTLSVSSSPGKGARFVIRLPVQGRPGHHHKLPVCRH